MNKQVVFVLLVLTGLSLLHAEDPQKQQLQLNSNAPTFMLKNLKDEWVSLHDFCAPLRTPWKNKNKYNCIISFWATYCKPCKKEIPELEKLIENYSVNTRLILVSIDKEGQDIVAPHVAQAGYKNTVLLDPFQQTAKKYMVESVPALFLVDKEGKLQYQCYGYKDTGIDELKKILDAIAKDSPAPSDSLKTAK